MHPIIVLFICGVPPMKKSRKLPCALSEVIAVDVVGSLLGVTISTISLLGGVKVILNPQLCFVLVLLPFLFF